MTIEQLRPRILARLALRVMQGLTAYEDALGVACWFQGQGMTLDEWRALAPDVQAVLLQRHDAAARHELDAWCDRASAALAAAEGAVWRAIGGLIDARAPSEAILAAAREANRQRKSVLTDLMIEETVARRMRMELSKKRRPA